MDFKNVLIASSLLLVSLPMEYWRGAYFLLACPTEGETFSFNMC
ncbi:MAG: hypothetical protein PVH88_24995 [Ignavibacteria bacterium]